MNVTPNNFTVSNLKYMFESGTLILRPDYQRGSVWKDNQRSYFIDSLLRGIPIPKILLELKYIDDGIIHYVLDGQQRLSTIFNFINKKYKLTKWCPEHRGKYFDELPISERTKILSYNFSTDIVIEGTNEEIRDIYVRLNTGGVKLNDQEIRYAKYNGEFKQLVYELEKNHYFSKIGMFNEMQVVQMHESKFISSILMFIINNDVHKDDKRNFERYYEQFDKSFPDKDKVKTVFEKVYKEITKILPDINTTIFKEQSRFYPLFTAFYHYIYGDYTLGLDIDNVRRLLLDIHLNYENKEMPIFRDFYDSTSAHTNNVKNRKIARNIIIDVLSVAYIVKDSVRLFSEYQKQYLWHKSEDKICCLCNNIILSYKDVHVDHIIPWTNGGKTILENAQITHSSCNLSKNKY